jgi:sialate O-acetylesterase
MTTGAEQTIQQAKNPLIRLFTVTKATADQPLEEVKGTWRECNPESVKNFSAVAYFFGRDLQKALNVPVGLIHTSWGGTRAEAWTRREVLESQPEWRDEFPRYEQAKADYPNALAQYRAEQEKRKEATTQAKEKGQKPQTGSRPPSDPARNSNSPSVLYNAMIAPLIPYGIKGAIWLSGGIERRGRLSISQALSAYDPELAQ